MDIVNEIDRLPQYYYLLKNGEIILGDNSSSYKERANEKRASMDCLYSFGKEIKEYYEKDGEEEILLDEEKREYAQMVYKMMQHSEERKINLGKNLLKKLIYYLKKIQRKLNGKLICINEDEGIIANMFGINDLIKGEYGKIP